MTPRTSAAGVALIALWLIVVLGHPAPALAQSAGSAAADPDVLTVPASNEVPPIGRRRAAREVIAQAERTEAVRSVRREHRTVRVRAYLKGEDRWQVSYHADTEVKRQEEVAQILISDSTGRVEEAWTGIQVAWSMARGYPGAFGRRINALYVWLPLCVLFLLPFLRRPVTLVHLDLLVLLGFSVSYAAFGAAEIGLSVPLAYPLLVYLLLRMLAIARRRARDRAPRRPLNLLVGPEFLGIAIVFLLGFRIGLNVTSSNVIDVGYAGVIGADRFAAGESLYGNFPKDNPHGDTYGPVSYFAYMPFEALMPWRGTWDGLPAAHAAAVVFDLATTLVLWLVGRRLRGPRLGLLLAYLWLSFPFSLLVACSNSNDALVPLLVGLALLVLQRPAARGVMLALAGLAKFAPLALGPLLATAPRGDAEGRPELRAAVATTAAFGVAAALLLVPTILIEGGLIDMWNRSVRFQADRDSPFSIWGYWGLEGPQRIVQIAAVVLAVAVAFVPRTRDVISVAALAAAVLIALQLGVSHWFYLYIVWFAPFVWIAGLAAHAEPAPEPVVSAG